MVGKVYKIVEATTNDVYIGSTFATLKCRMSQHRNSTNKTSTLAWMNDKPHSDFKMILIREYDTDDRKTLHAYEQLWINKLKPTINERLAFDPLVGRCSHAKDRRYCLLCFGSRICSHDKHPRACKECSPVTCEKCLKTYTQNSIKQHMKICKA